MIEAVGHGIHRWELRHPEWHPGEFGAQVGAYLVHEGENTVLIDPLLDDDVMSALDDLVRGEVVIIPTSPSGCLKARRSTATRTSRSG